MKRALLLMLMTGPAIAGPCLEAPWRDQPCPNVRYQSVIGDNGARMVCVCAPDFDHLKTIPDTVAGKALRTKELERIAASYALSDSEVRQLLQLED
ncbi:hypothetical protein KUV89_13200 [Marinobacter hydrocarbonoclasticus]|nr:hypothetical protein [Marinobacter nauticus]